MPYCSVGFRTGVDVCADGNGKGQVVVLNAHNLHLDPAGSRSERNDSGVLRPEAPLTYFYPTPRLDHPHDWGLGILVDDGDGVPGVDSASVDVGWIWDRSPGRILAVRKFLAELPRTSGGFFRGNPGAHLGD
jgi:hypothetical protein